jgi:ABC-type lipoprotein release transport system permease subunit
MKKRLPLVAFAISSLARRRVKAIAVGGGLFFAVTLLSAVLFLSDALRAESERAEAAWPHLTVSRLVGGRPGVIAVSDAKALDGVLAVKSVRPRVWGYVFLPALQGNVTVVGVAKDAAVPEKQLRDAIGAGRDLTPGAHEMVLGKDLARFLGLRIGDELGLPSVSPKAKPLKVVGTFASSVDLYASDVVLCDDEDARAILGYSDDQATDLAVTLTNDAESTVATRTIIDKLPGTRVVEKTAATRAYVLAYGRRAGLVLAACIPVVLALLMLAWDRLSGVGPEERREIGVLKAVGFSTSDVLWLKLTESLLSGVLATALGLVAGYVWVFVLDAPGLRAALVGWSVLYPTTPLTPQVDLAEVLGIALAVLGPFVLLSIVPAWRAAITDPMDVLRA